MNFPLAELDDVILMGFPGLERAWEGEELPVLPGVGEQGGHRVELQGGVLPIEGRGRLNLHQQTSAGYPAPKNIYQVQGMKRIYWYMYMFKSPVTDPDPDPFLFFLLVSTLEKIQIHYRNQVLHIKKIPSNWKTRLLTVNVVKAFT